MREFIEDYNKHEDVSMWSKVKKFIFEAGLILLTASTAFAEDASSVTDNLGPASGIANDIMTYAKWGAIAVAIVSLLFLWISGNIARVGAKANEVLHVRESIKGWFAECIIVILGLLFLFQYIIPQLNKLV
jgi:hypothetical protein